MPRRRIPANITDRIKKLLPKTPLMHLVLVTLPFFIMDSEESTEEEGLPPAKAEKKDWRELDRCAV